MKTLQWTGAILALAAVVFIVTFVMNFLGGEGNTTVAPQKQQGVNRLYFPIKKAPSDGPPLICEANQPGYYDFWFVNKNAQETRVGLHTKSCKCTEIELFTAPPAFQDQLAAHHAALWGMLVRGGPGLIAGGLFEDSACAGAWDLAMTQLAQSAPSAQTLQPNEAGASVAGGAIGWVRVKWSAEKSDMRLLDVKLWMDHEGAGITELVTGVHIPEPMKSDSTVAVGSLTDRELPRQASLHCWSLTRPALKVKARVAHERGGPASDPLQVGEPVLLSEKELHELANKQGVRRILTGYRIPVTLLPRSPDGTTPFELGHIRRYIELSSEEAGTVPVEVPVEGTVLGDVTVGRKQGGAVDFGSFRSSRGARLTIPLETDAPNVELELDRSRVPDFVKVEVPDRPELAPSGHRYWQVEVQVLPHRAQGSFPRDNDPAYRDSAIYFKIRGPHARAIRIPLRGTANEG